MDFLEPTLPEPRDVIRRQLLNSAKSAYQQFRQAYRVSYGRVWHHPTLTPSEVLDALGTDAADYLAVAYASYQFVNAIAGNDPLDLPALREIVIHSDGTATLAPESSSSSKSSSSSASSVESEETAS